MEQMEQKYAPSTELRSQEKGVHRLPYPIRAKYKYLLGFSFQPLYPVITLSPSGADCLRVGNMPVMECRSDGPHA
jgi:hypothetical protein